MKTTGKAGFATAIIVKVERLVKLPVWKCFVLTDVNKPASCKTVFAV